MALVDIKSIEAEAKKVITEETTKKGRELFRAHATYPLAAVDTDVVNLHAATRLELS